MGDVNFKGGLLPYLNPPFIALLFSPLSFLPISAAYFSWMVMEIGLLIWLIVLLNKLFYDWTKQERRIMTLTILAFWPLTITVLLGQFSLLFLISMLQMYLAIRRSKWGKAGLWLVLLIIKPQTLPIPGVMTLNRRFWRIAITAAISGIAIIIFSSIFLGFSVWLQYIHVLSTMISNFGKQGFNPDVQYTLRGILTNILGYSHAKVINFTSAGIFIVGVLFVWLIWMKRVPADSQRFKLYFAFTILLSAFLSLHTYPHDDLILVLPAALFYDYLQKNNAPRKAYYIVILVSPVVFFIGAFTRFNLFGVLRPPVAIILILITWIIIYMIKDFRINYKNGSTAIKSINQL
jgi:hypothetical protein